MLNRETCATLKPQRSFSVWHELLQQYYPVPCLDLFNNVNLCLAYQMAGIVGSHSLQSIHDLVEMLEERHQFCLKAFGVHITDTGHSQTDTNVKLSAIHPVRWSIPTESRMHSDTPWSHSCLPCKPFLPWIVASARKYTPVYNNSYWCAGKVCTNMDMLHKKSRSCTSQSPRTG